MSTAYAVHACDPQPGDRLPHGNQVVRTIPWPDVDVEIVFANGGLERYRYKPQEWITILVDNERQEASSGDPIL